MSVVKHSCALPAELRNHNPADLQGLQEEVRRLEETLVLAATAAAASGGAAVTMMGDPEAEAEAGQRREILSALRAEVVRLQEAAEVTAKADLALEALHKRMCPAADGRRGGHCTPCSSLTVQPSI